MEQLEHIKIAPDKNFSYFSLKHTWDIYYKHLGKHLENIRVSF